MVLLLSGSPVLWQLPRNEHACQDRKSTRLNSSHSQISYAVFCLQKTSNHSSPSKMMNSWCNARTSCRLTLSLSKLYRTVLTNHSHDLNQAHLDSILQYHPLTLSP